MLMILSPCHYSSLHVGQIMELEVEIPVCVHGIPVDRDIQAAILSSPE